MAEKAVDRLWVFIPIVVLEINDVVKDITDEEAIKKEPPRPETSAADFLGYLHKCT